MTSIQKMVEEFHRKMDLPVHRGAPRLLNGDRRALRQSLIREEFIELDDAMVRAHAMCDPMANVAKEAADLVYVIFGMAVEMGFDLHAAFEEVHRSNMSKDGRKRADGKVLKGNGYKPADPDRLIRPVSND